MGNCWSHGKYDGWSCPVCDVEEAIKKQTETALRLHEEEMYAREEQARTLQEAQEEAAFRAEMASIETQSRMQALAEQQKRNIAEAPRLQAKAMSERAYELYRVGLYEDAFKTSLKAIELDRTNIYATETAAWALTKRGREPEARLYYEKQLALLNTSEYMSSPAWFKSVLQGLPDDNELLGAFSNTLRRNSRQWAAYGDCFDLIDALMDRKLLDDAEALTETLIANANSLMLQAYLFEISQRVGKSSNEGLSKFLQSIPFNKRSEVLRSFEDLSSRKARLSGTTVSEVKEAICKRYKAWRPDIENNLADAITNETRKARSGAAWGCGFMIFCFVAMLVVGNYLHHTPLQHLWLATDGMKVFAPVSILASIFTGLWIGHITGRYRSAKYTGERMRVAEEQENQTWGSIGPMGVSIPKPMLLSVFIELILFLIVLAVIFFGLFSYLSSAQDSAMRAAGLDPQATQLPVATTYSPSAITGTWTGDLNGQPTTLVIKTQKGKSFSGTLSQAGFLIAIKGSLTTDNYQISFKETRILEKPSGGIWALGTESGSISADGRSMTGEGRDGERTYSWSFSRQ